MPPPAAQLQSASAGAAATADISCDGACWGPKEDFTKIIARLRPPQACIPGRSSAPPPAAQLLGLAWCISTACCLTVSEGDPGLQATTGLITRAFFTTSICGTASLSFCWCCSHAGRQCWVMHRANCEDRRHQCHSSSGPSQAWSPGTVSAPPPAARLRSLQTGTLTAGCRGTHGINTVRLQMLATMGLTLPEACRPCSTLAPTHAEPVSAGWSPPTPPYPPPKSQHSACCGQACPAHLTHTAAAAPPHLTQTAQP